MVKKIYGIPGFGVDERVFSKLHLNAPMQVINWLQPYTKEPIEQYAQRMAMAINQPNPVIVGVSFGGMVALEIAKLRPVKKIILISSVKCRRELPMQLRWIGMLKLNMIFPVKKIQQSERVYEIANKRLGAYTTEEKELANGYRRNANIDYVNWSFDTILNWRNKECPKGVVHIHGDKDAIFPIRTISPTHTISGGTHMMVMNRANEISQIINNELKTL